MAETLSPDGSRRSREGWADAMEAGPPDRPMHTHRLPPAFRFALLGLVLAVFLCLIGMGLMATFVYQQQQYIQGRGELRDREQIQLRELLREEYRLGQCKMLDEFPADVPSLDRLRDLYECPGPGIPMNLLPPDEQAQYTPKKVRPEVVPGPPAALGDAATPNAQGLSPAQPGA